MSKSYYKFHNNKIFLLIFITIILIALLTTSCELYDNVKFPEISEPNNIIPTPTSEKEDDELIPSGEINIALPISQETMNSLINLYVGKLTGIFSENGNQNGLNISLETLNEYDVGLYANKIESSTLGFSAEEILQMSNSGTLPDIYLTKDTFVFDNNGNELALNLEGEYLNKYIIPKNVYSQLFTRNLISDSVYSLPYYARVKMLYINKSLFDSDVIDPLLYNYPITFNSVANITSTISNLEDSEIFAWNDLFELSAFLPGSLATFPENFLFSKKSISFENESYITSMDMLIELSTDAKVIEKLSDDEYADLFENNNPIENNKVFFWIDYSDQLSNNNNSASRYPLPIINKMNIPISTVNIAVNPNGEHRNISKNLSIFMAYDVDALLLKSRFETEEGFIPMVNDTDVWEHLVLNQEAGRDLFLLKDFIDKSYLIHPSQEEILSSIYKTLYDKYVYNILYNNASIEESVKLMDNEAGELFDE